MPKNKEDQESPKRSKYNLRKRKQLQAKKHEDSDSDEEYDSSSDYDPQKDEMEQLDSRELQRFIQKIFPSKAGKERLKQLEKIDKMMEQEEKKGKSKKNRKNKSMKNKKINKKISKKESDDEEEEEVEEVEDEEQEEEDEEQDYDDCEYVLGDDEFPNEDEELDSVMKDMLGNNMKFNIIFTVGQNQGDMDYYDEAFEESEWRDEEDTEEEEEESEEEEEEEEEEKNSKKKSKKSKTDKDLKDKNMDDITEEEWLKLAAEQEKEMRKNGTYYATKYQKGDKILYKKKGWDEFKKGQVTNVNRHKHRSKVTYDIKLNKSYKPPRIHKKIPSTRLKKQETEDEEDPLAELEELMKLKKNKGSEAMKKKFEELSKAKEKRDAKKQKKKEAKLKEKNFHELRKLMRERNTMNDFKFFKGMELEQQKMILTKLKEVNSFVKIDKPYRMALLESDIPVEFKANALKKINTLEYMDPGSGEYYKIKQWVDTFMRIPFSTHQNLPISIKDGPEVCQEFMENAKKTLDEAVYGLNDAKMQILQMVGQWISNPDSLGTAIAVKGPPGTGKTTLIKEGVSKILNRPFAFLALGGATDSSYLEGHSYTYEGSSWGKIVDIIINCKCMNPVIYFDELDKISDTPKGEEIVGILTHLTDTTQNDKFHDKYFSNIDFNLSKAMFIFSYNEESKVNPILKDRMYRIKTDGYKNDDKCVISRDYLIPRIEKNVNFEKGQIIIPDETIRHIADTLTENEKGVRNLKRCLEIIYTKLNLYRLMKEGSTLFNKEETIKVEFPFTVTKEVVGKLIKKTKENNVLAHMYL